MRRWEKISYLTYMRNIPVQKTGRNVYVLLIAHAVRSRRAPASVTSQVRKLAGGRQDLTRPMVCLLTLRAPGGPYGGSPGPDHQSHDGNNQPHQHHVLLEQPTAELQQTTYRLPINTAATPALTMQRPPPSLRQASADDASASTDGSGGILLCH